MVQIQMERVTGDYGFVARDEMGHTMFLDSSSGNGGMDSGIRPMQSLLMGLGGCSAIDIVSILKKQRQEVTGFNINIKGEREAGKVPSLWKEVHIQFILSGNLEEEKTRKACALSVDKYCSVAETLRRAGATITWDLVIHPVNS